jgi:hypothetical protein
MTETIAREIKEFVVTNFLFGQQGTGLADDQSFLESGMRSRSPTASSCRRTSTRSRT